MFLPSLHEDHRHNPSPDFVPAILRLQVDKSEHQKIWVLEKLSHRRIYTQPDRNSKVPVQRREEDHVELRKARIVE